MSVIDIKDPSMAKKEKLSDHFTGKEFVCDCGQLKIDTAFINKLETLRKLLNVPMTITSGYRCPKDNAAAHGAKQSMHLYGQACDFMLNGKMNGMDVFYQATAIMPRAGFYQSGRDKNKSYIHVDIKPESLYWLSYMSNGTRVYKYFNTLDQLVAYAKKDTVHNWMKLVI